MVLHRPIECTALYVQVEPFPTTPLSSCTAESCALKESAQLVQGAIHAVIRQLARRKESRPVRRQIRAYVEEAEGSRAEGHLVLCQIICAKLQVGEVQSTLTPMRKATMSARARPRVGQRKQSNKK